MKIKAYIHAVYCEYSKTYSFNVWSHDMSSANCGPLVGTHEFEFDAPPHDVLVAGTIEGYRDQQKKVIAEAERMSNEIQQRINDMLCIEHKPVEA